MEDWEEPDLGESLDGTEGATQQTVELFHGMELADIEAWLRIGLEQFLFEGVGAWSFPGAEAEFARWETPAEALQVFYKRLQAERKAKFRLAVANVMASLDSFPENIPIFEHLLEIAVAVGAYEILRVLPGKIGNGFFGQDLDDTGKRKLFAAALLVTARLSTPRVEAKACLEALIDSRPFRETGFAYAGIALISLCRADPDGWMLHLNRLRGPLHLMFRKYRTNEAAKRRLGRDVLDAVGLQRIADSLLDLVCFEPGFPVEDTDDWLLHALVVGDDPPLILVEDNDEALRIRRPNQESGGFFSFILLENISYRGVHTLSMLRMRSLIHCEEVCDSTVQAQFTTMICNAEVVLSSGRETSDGTTVPGTREKSGVGGSTMRGIAQAFGLPGAMESCHVK
ncbi:MAG: hypothetical protein HQL52_17735 [Magnetococcales bacterium]|nr:hypothetical protein [Magnetococcales bacterium]